MHKKTLFLSLVTISSMAFAQCNIIGKPTLQINETAQYSVDTDAQCTECYQWKSTSNNIVIMDNGKNKNITIKGTGNGNTNLSISILTPNGISECNKTIEVHQSASSQQITTNNNLTSEINKNSNCDIDIAEFKEAKVSDNIMGFFPTSTLNVYNYSWEIEYFNGQKNTSAEKVPQFVYNKTELPFKTVKLKVTSKKCLKEFTKIYDESFWRFFN